MGLGGHERRGSGAILNMDCKELRRSRGLAGRGCKIKNFNSFNRRSIKMVACCWGMVSREGYVNYVEERKGWP